MMVAQLTLVDLSVLCRPFKGSSVLAFIVSLRYAQMVSANSLVSSLSEC